jgi:hypothetical protein
MQGGTESRCGSAFYHTLGAQAMPIVPETLVLSVYTATGKSSGLFTVQLIYVSVAMDFVGDVIKTIDSPGNSMGTFVQCNVHVTYTPSVLLVLGGSDKIFGRTHPQYRLSRMAPEAMERPMIQPLFDP